jgi:Domain of unknown function (DUF4157)
MLSPIDSMKSYDRERERDEQWTGGHTQAPPETTAVERLASNVGNSAFGALAREGAGILPSGLAHPDVQHAIARRRGQGSPPRWDLLQHFESELGAPFQDVRFHTDREADALARSVASRAFTTGTDIYFADGQFNPGTSEGRRLIGHELTHVAQQRGAPTSGPLRVSQPGEPLEREAEAASRGIA